MLIPCRMGLTTLVRNHWQKYKQPFIFCIIGSSMETRSVANSAFSSRLEPLLWTALKWLFISVNTVHWHTQSELIYGKLKLSFSHKLENSLPHNLVLHISSQWTYPSSWRISVSIRSNSLSWSLSVVLVPSLFEVLVKHKLCLTSSFYLV